MVAETRSESPRASSPVAALPPCHRGSSTVVLGSVPSSLSGRGRRPCSGNNSTERTGSHTTGCRCTSDTVSHPDRRSLPVRIGRRRNNNAVDIAPERRARYRNLDKEDRSRNPRRLSGSNKAFSMIPKNEILLRESAYNRAKTLLPQRPIGSRRHHSSVGRAAAL